MRTGSTPLFLLVLAGLAITSAAGCSERAIKTSHDEKVSVSEYADYAWLDTESARRIKLEDPHIEYSFTRVTVERNPKVEDRLKSEIDEDLRRQGYQEQDSTGVPDFYVAYYGLSPRDTWVSTWEGNPPGFDGVPVVIYPDYERTRLRDHRDEDVAVVFYDAKTGRPVWTGTIPGVLDGNPETIRHLGELLKQMFDKLPSKSS